MGSIQESPQESPQVSPQVYHKPHVKFSPIINHKTFLSSKKITLTESELEFKNEEINKNNKHSEISVENNKICNNKEDEVKEIDLFADSMGTSPKVVEADSIGISPKVIEDKENDSNNIIPNSILHKVSSIIPKVPLAPHNSMILVFFFLILFQTINDSNHKAPSLIPNVPLAPHNSMISVFFFLILFQALNHSNSIMSVGNPSSLCEDQDLYFYSQVNFY